MPVSRDLGHLFGHVRACGADDFSAQILDIGADESPENQRTLAQNIQFAVLRLSSRNSATPATPIGRKGIAELATKLEAVPRRQMEYKGASFEEMDVDAILISMFSHSSQPNT
jgi:hypothetical protein